MIPSKSPSRNTSGRQLISGADINNIIDQLNSVQNGVAAEVGGTQALATQLNAAVVQVSTVAGAADGVRLPKGFAGLSIFIANQGANPIQVFGFGTDTINGVATATGVAQANAKNAIYTCIVGPTAAVPAAQWVQTLGA